VARTGKKAGKGLDLGGSAAQSVILMLIVIALIRAPVPLRRNAAVAATTYASTGLLATEPLAPNFETS
jgi:hypothetical protein